MLVHLEPELSLSTAFQRITAYYNTIYVLSPVHRHKGCEEEVLDNTETSEKLKLEIALIKSVWFVHHLQHMY